MDRLLSTGQIYDAQPTHAQAYVALGVDSFFIRAAVDDGLGHAPNLRGAYNLVLPADHSRYSTHVYNSPAGCPALCPAKDDGSAGLRPRTEIGTFATCKSSRPQLSNQRNASS